MKKYILYVFALVLGILLFLFSRGDRSETVAFYGFSENKEQELNFDYDVKVIEIMVNSGQYVNEGDPMLRVERTSNPLRMSDIENKIALIKLRENAGLLEIQNEIIALQSEEERKFNEIASEIKALKSKLDRNQVLLNVIDDMDFKSDSALRGSDQLKIEELERQKKYLRKSAKSEISMKSNKHASVKAQYELELANLQQEKEFYLTQEKNQLLRAPVDGIVGFINCNPGENYSSFSKLLSLYDPHPQLVKGYILESMITSIEIDDSVVVSSALDPSKSYKGIVSGFGTRIMEIPNRLSKIPELTMYGREVLIMIPPKNNLLQKEKVRVELIMHEDENIISKKISNF